MAGVTEELNFKLYLLKKKKKTLKIILGTELSLHLFSPFYIYLTVFLFHHSLKKKTTFN